MIDLHTHSLFSDGQLVPAEHLRRVEVMDYTAIAITDHADGSNLDFIVPRLVAVARELNRHCRTKLLPGIELTHVPPPLIAELTERARSLGAVVVVGHGETVAEPVAPGTNLAFIEAGVDILAHPGFITQHEVQLATDRGILLELSARKGHCLTNGHVAARALSAGAKIAVNADAHGPGDFLTEKMAETVARGAGLTQDRYREIRRDMERFASQALARLA